MNETGIRTDILNASVLSTLALLALLPKRRFAVFMHLGAVLLALLLGATPVRYCTHRPIQPRDHSPFWTTAPANETVHVNKRRFTPKRLIRPCLRAPRARARQRRDHDTQEACQLGTPCAQLAGFRGGEWCVSVPVVLRLVRPFDGDAEVGRLRGAQLR